MTVLWYMNAQEKVNKAKEEFPAIWELLESLHYTDASRLRVLCKIADMVEREGFRPQRLSENPEKLEDKNGKLVWTTRPLGVF